MLYPLKFKPRLKPRIWGGGKLGELGKQVPAGQAIGESWELSGVQDDLSVITNGFLKDNDLQEIIEVYMDEIVGEANYEKYGIEFPILVKFIDAHDVLSIQVHPDDELAKERHHSYGKTEMWYVIAAEPGASLYVGFNRQVSREEYLRAVSQGTLPSLLRKVEVKPGDAYFIPAGTIHAIGKGLLIAEIQETSDITYRVDDWGRVDANGNPRELHTDLAVDAIDFSAPQDYDITRKPAAGQSVRLKECAHFTTNIAQVEGELIRDYSALDSFVIYICLAGEAEMTWGTGEKEILAKGDTVLIPAALNEIRLEGKATFLEVWL